MELYLIRHGQSANNAQPQELRVQDPPLTEIGRRQSELLAQWIQAVGLTRLITSPFRRTLQTTEPLRRTTGLEPHIWTELHEQGGCVSGVALDVMVGEPGMTGADIRRDFPGYRMVDPLDGQGWWNCRPYETVDEAIQRAGLLIQRTRDEFADSSHRVAFVMHGIFKRIFTACLVSESHPNAQQLGTVHNTSVSKFVITPDQARLEYFNRIDHLTGELITS